MHQVTEPVRIMFRPAICSQAPSQSGVLQNTHTQAWSGHGHVLLWPPVGVSTCMQEWLLPVRQGSPTLVPDW